MMRWGGREGISARGFSPLAGGGGESSRYGPLDCTPSLKTKSREPLGNGSTDRSPGAVCLADAIGRHSRARAAPCKAGAARHPGGHSGGRGTARGARAEGRSRRHCRNRGHGICAGLAAAGISRAMRIATTLLLTPSYTNAVAGATALNVAGGMSGFAAALAPELARAGFEAQDDAIEQALGDLVGSGFTPERLLEDLGTVWHITRNYFRLYACCNPIHPALDCLQEALAALHPQPDEVERIDIATYRFASVMRNPDPPNYFASKYSLPHAAAAMVVRAVPATRRSTVPLCGIR